MNAKTGNHFRDPLGEVLCLLLPVSLSTWHGAMCLDARMSAQTLVSDEMEIWI